MSENLSDPINTYLQSKEGKSFEVPLQGSLGLLALGDIGLWMWRQKKLEYLKSKNNEMRKNEVASDNADKG